MNERSWKKSSLAGFMGGLIKIFFFPLELAKVQLIGATPHKDYFPRYKHSFHALVSLYKQQGIYSIYRGWYFTLLSSCSWSVYFGIYETLKKSMPVEFDQNHHELAKISTTSGAAIISKIILNPVQVVRTRVMLSYHEGSWAQHFVDTAKNLWRVDGLKGLWSGLLPGLALSLNGGVQLYLYETLKENIESQESNSKTMLAGGLSKVGSSILFHPVVTVRYRLQQHQYYYKLHGGQFQKEKLYGGVTDVIKKTWSHEGVKGFYRGLGVNICRLVPEYAFFFLIYENTLKLLK